MTGSCDQQEILRKYCTRLDGSQIYKPYDAIYKRQNQAIKKDGIQGICMKIVVARKPAAAISITTIAT
jgi:hypothetical protein